MKLPDGQTRLLAPENHISMVAQDIEIARRALPGNVPSPVTREHADWNKPPPPREKETGKAKGKGKGKAKANANANANVNANAKGKGKATAKKSKTD